MTQTAARERTARPLPPPLPVARGRTRVDGYRAGVAASTLAVAAFLAARLTAWPPHEDETLPLFVGHGSFQGLLDTVLGERGGAPLHYVVAWVVAHLGGGFGELRLVSAAFAVASVPLVAELGRRLADRATGALAAALAAGSWILLFHGVYARMYSLFLFFSALSYLAFLVALRSGGTRRWAAWAAAVLLTVATHPYGALVLASQALYVLAVRERLREALLAFGAVGVLGTPFWVTNLVLARRFDVGVGGEAQNLGGPVAVAGYLAESAADASAGPVVLPVTLALAAAGAWLLARTRPRSALLVAAVVGTPTLAFLVVGLGSSASPESRHVIFVLPFFATLVATALVTVGRSGRPGALGAAVFVSALLVGGGVGYAAQKTTLMFEGEPAERAVARDQAARWLARTGRRNDILLGYEPVFLGAWERSDAFSRFVLPRADARLQAQGLSEAEKPLGRGVWVLNAADTTNAEMELDIRRRFPRPAGAFEARAFGPYLVLRTRKSVKTADRWFELAASAMVLGKQMGIGDADINHATISRAARILDYSANRSRSTSSR